MLRPLGRGGNSEVYLARDLGLGRKVAVKVLRPEAIGTPELVARFVFEAKITARFNHPHIITIYAVSEHEGWPVLALEYLKGRTLRERIEEGRVGPKEALRILRAIVDGLAEAHRNGVLHRDLKPENVMFGADGRLRILDLGLAKQIPGLEAPQDTSEVRAALTTTMPSHAESHGGLRGTPAYMAPEQWEGHDATEACDIWALGVIAHELLLARRPYDETSMIELAVRVCAEESVPCPTGLPPELRKLVCECLAKAPADRPSAQDILQLLDESASAAPDPKSVSEAGPFRGLLPFEDSHAAQFFGRHEEIVQVVERLRSDPFVAIIGPSGAGKSSFVMAGLLPRLRELVPTELIRMRPGARPFLTLASRLASAHHGRTSQSPLGILPAEAPPPADGALAERLEAEPGFLGVTLRQVSARRSTAVVLLVDQLEELFTLTTELDTQEAFLRALALAADDPDTPVRVVITLREEFLSRAARVPEMKDALHSLALLLAPQPSGLQDLLRRTVKSVGYRFEDPTMADRMVAEVATESSCLPLLQFAGQELWRRRDRDRRLLTEEAYAEIGGVAGALADHAEASLAGLEGGELEHARTALLRLITPEGTRRALTRAHLLDGLGPGAAEVVRLLCEARLLVERHSQASQDVEIELAHESLITAWSRLRRWRDQGHEDIARLTELEQVAEVWVSRGARTDETWQGDAQRDAERTLAHTALPVPKTVRHFVDAGRTRAQRQQVRRRAVRVLGAVVLLSMTVVAISVALVLSEKEQAAVQAGLRAQGALSHALVEAARRSQQSKVFQEAERFAAQALIEDPAFEGSPEHVPGYLRAPPDSRHVAADAVSVLYELSFEPRADVIGTCNAGSGSASQLTFSPGGRWLLEHGYPWTGAYRKRVVARIIAAETGAVRAELAATDFDTPGALFLPGDRYALIVHASHYAVLYDLEAGTVARALPAPRPGARAHAFARHASGWVAVADQSGQVDLFGPDWTSRGGPLEHRAPVVSMAFVEDEQLLTVTASGAVTLWNWRAPRRLHQRTFHTSQHARVTAVRDSALIVWPRRSFVRVKLPDLSPAWPTASGPTPAREARITGDGTEIVALPDSQRLHLHALKTETTEELRSHEDLYTFAMVPSSRLLTTNGAGWTTALFDRDTRQLQARLPATDNLLVRMAFSPDGRRLAIGDASGRVRVMRWSAGRPILDLPPPRCTALAVSPDGLVLAGGSNRARAITLWDATTGRQIRTIPNQGEWVASLAFSQDGRYLASIDYDHPGKIWDLETGRAEIIDPTSQIFVDLSSDGRKVAFQRDGLPMVRDLHGGGVRRAPEVGGGRVAFSHDGRYLAYGPRGSADVLLWPQVPGLEQVRLDLGGSRASAVAFSPDDTLVAAAHYKGRVRVWSLKDRSALWTDEQERWINTVRFSPDGRLLVTGGDDMTATVYDVHTGRRRLRLGFPSGVNDAVFVDGGRGLAICSASGLRLLPFLPDELDVDPEARLRRVQASSGAALGAPVWLRDEDAGAGVDDE